MDDDEQTWVCHVDVDAMFAQVHVRDDSTLEGDNGRPNYTRTPVLVGGGGPRSVVAAANYAAKELGVSSGMPMGAAQRLCKLGWVRVDPDFGRYREASRMVMGALVPFAVDGLLEQTSVDECYLQIDTADPVGTAEEMLRAVWDAAGLSVSVGVASTKVAAKLLSGWTKKANGPGTVAHKDGDGLLRWMRRLKVSALPGCGPVARAELARIGVVTVADLLAADRGSVVRAVGEATADWLLRAAVNDDPRPVQLPGPAKSVSHERTYDVDVADEDELMVRVRGLAGQAAGALDGRFGRTVTVKLRTSGWTNVTRSLTLDTATDDPEMVADVAMDLVGSAWDAAGRQPVRLVGVGLSNLTDVAQVRLF